MSAAEIDWEAALISAIVSRKDIRTVIKAKLTTEFFFQPLNRAAFKWLLQHYANPLYGDTPSWESFQHSFSGFIPVELDDSIPALCSKVREHKLYNDIAATLQDVADTTTGDPFSGLDRLRELTSHLSSLHRVDSIIDIRSQIETLREEYFRMKENPTGLKGKPYPWDALNRATLGAQNGQYILIYGRPKRGKTWYGLYVCQTWHAHGDRPLILSQELSDIEMCRRYVALSTCVPYGLYQRGQLPPDMEADFLENLTAFIEQPPVMITQLASRGEQALIDIGALIDEYGATSVFIDGVHNLGVDTKELYALSKGLKGLAGAKKVPMLMTTHANKSRGKQSNEATLEGGDDIAHADAFFQDSDLAIRLTADIEDMKQNQVKMFTAAVREGTSTLFVVNRHLCQDLTQKAVIRFGESDSEDEPTVEGDVDAEPDVRE